MTTFASLVSRRYASGRETWQAAMNPNLIMPPTTASDLSSNHSSSSSSSSSNASSFSLARTPQLRLPDVPRSQACPDTSRCPAVGTTRRVFLIEGGKEDGAFAQTFYQIVVNGVLHAWRENMVPLVKFSPHRVAKTLGTDWWRRNGTGELWDTLFEPYCANVSEWLHACPNVKSVGASVNWWYYTVGMAAPWAVHSWVRAPYRSNPRPLNPPCAFAFLEPAWPTASRREDDGTMLLRGARSNPVLAGQLEQPAAAGVHTRATPARRRPRVGNVRSLR